MNQKKFLFYFFCLFIFFISNLFADANWTDAYLKAYDTGTLYYKDSNNNEKNHIQSITNFEIKPRYEFQTNNLTPYNTGVAGGTQTFQIDITNLANISDSFILIQNNSTNWSWSFHQTTENGTQIDTEAGTTASVVRNNSTTVFLKVDIPISVNLGDADTLILAVWSYGDTNSDLTIDTGLPELTNAQYCTVCVTVKGPEMTLSKTYSAEFGTQPGDTVTFILTYNNIGSDSAHYVIISDTIHERFLFLKNSADSSTAFIPSENPSFPIIQYHNSSTLNWENSEPANVENIDGIRVGDPSNDYYVPNLGGPWSFKFKVVIK